MSWLLAVTFALAAEPHPVPERSEAALANHQQDGRDPAAATSRQPPPDPGDAQAREDARVRELLVQLNQSRLVSLAEGLGVVDQTERHCTVAWADDLLRVRGAWDVQRDQLLTWLKQPGGEWADPPRDEVALAAQAEIEDQLLLLEREFLERARLMNQLMERCPEHKKALQGHRPERAPYTDSFRSLDGFPSGLLRQPRAAHQAAKMGGRARVAPDQGGKNLSSPRKKERRHFGRNGRPKWSVPLQGIYALGKTSFIVG